MNETNKMPVAQKQDEITFDEFIELVKQMRHNQRRYFNNGRSISVLDTCKKLEKQVDEIINFKTDKQLRLF